MEFWGILMCFRGVASLLALSAFISASLLPSDEGRLRFVLFYTIAGFCQIRSLGSSCVGYQDRGLQNKQAELGQTWK
jgi:hypothetical protein